MSIDQEGGLYWLENVLLLCSVSKRLMPEHITIIKCMGSVLQCKCMISGSCETKLDNLQVFSSQLKAYSTLTDGLAHFPPLRYATPDLAATSEGFVASGHTFKVHPDLDPAKSGYYQLRPQDTRPQSWTIDSSAGSRTHLPLGLVTWDAANFTEPVTFTVKFTLKETWAASSAHTKAVWLEWEAWTKETMRTAPHGLQRGFQSSDVRGLLRLLWRDRLVPVWLFPTTANDIVTPNLSKTPSILKSI